jgi:hypothetical protein
MADNIFIPNNTIPGFPSCSTPIQRLRPICKEHMTKFYGPAVAEYQD